jgi:hypothetical protein
MDTDIIFRSLASRPLSRQLVGVAQVLGQNCLEIADRLIVGFDQLWQVSDITTDHCFGNVVRLLRLGDEVNDAGVGSRGFGDVGELHRVSLSSQTWKGRLTSNVLECKLDLYSLVEKYVRLSCNTAL